MSEIATWSLQRRLEEALRKALPKLGPEVRGQVEAMINPQALAIVAGVLIAWVVSHAFGLGQIIDILMVGVGAFSIGMAVFTGIDHLYDFSLGVYRARTDRDLDVAAEEFAEAVGILGVQGVLAVLFRGAKAPRTGKGGPVNVGRAPPPTPGARYRPTVKQDPTLPAGEGRTSFWGDIEVSTHGSATDRALALLHERVHQFLAPKFYLLRGYRVTNRASSYVRSSLWRYIEEALAEVVAQVGVKGVRQFFVGVRFPVQNGYMYLTRGGASSSFQRMGGNGLVPEGAALIYNGVVAGIAFEVRFVSTSPRSR